MREGASFADNGNVIMRRFLDVCFPGTSYGATLPTGGAVARVLGIGEDETARERMLTDGNLWRTMAAAAYIMTAGYGNHSCYDRFGGWAENTRLEEAYVLLRELGFELSDEEKALLDGSHELYKDGEDAE